jgi:hypothetical protein
MGLKEIRWEVISWVYVAKDSDMWGILVNTN